MSNEYGIISQETQNEGMSPPQISLYHTTLGSVP